jgi:hypothetical protein
VAQHGRPDLKTTTSFLTKQVREDTTDENDYTKLARAVKYIHRNKFRCLIIKATYLDQNHGFTNAAFSVHDGMRSCTGAYVTFVKGMLNGLSKR